MITETLNSNYSTNILEEGGDEMAVDTRRDNFKDKIYFSSSRNGGFDHFHAENRDTDLVEVSVLGQTGVGPGHRHK